MKVGPLEREILDVLWGQGPQPVGEILDTLNEGARRDRAHNTVMSTAAHMEGKHREGDGRADRQREQRRVYFRVPVAPATSSLPR